MFDFLPYDSLWICVLSQIFTKMVPRFGDNADGWWWFCDTDREGQAKSLTLRWDKVQKWLKENVHQIDSKCWQSKLISAVEVIGFIEGISAKRDRWDPPGFLGFMELSVKRQKNVKIIFWTRNAKKQFGRLNPAILTRKEATSCKPNFTFYTSRTQDFVLLSLPFFNMTTLCGFQT